MKLQRWKFTLIFREKIRLSVFKWTSLFFLARETGFEPATSAVTGRRSNQLSYSRRLVLGRGEWFLVRSERSCMM